MENLKEKTESAKKTLSNVKYCQKCTIICVLFSVPAN